MDIRWKEMVAAFVAGAKYVPLGDNGELYAELEGELERIRQAPAQELGAANDPHERDRAA